MTNLAALCADCGGTGVHSSTDELGGLSTNSFCPACDGSGYANPLGDTVDEALAEAE